MVDPFCAWCEASAEEIDELRAKLNAAESRARIVDAVTGVALVAIFAPIGVSVLAASAIASLFEKRGS